MEGKIPGHGAHRRLGTCLLLKYQNRRPEYIRSMVERSELVDDRRTF